MNPNQLPPHDLAAERGLLGSILRDNTVMADVADAVAPDSFYAHAHQVIYRAMFDLDAKREPIDLVTVANAIRAHLADVGGPIYLAELWEAAPTAQNADYYALIVREKADTRRLIHVAN